MSFEREEGATHSLSHPPAPRPSGDPNSQPSSLTPRHPTFEKRQVSFFVTFLWFFPAECVCSHSLTHSMPFPHTLWIYTVCCSCGKGGEGLCNISGLHICSEADATAQLFYHSEQIAVLLKKQLRFPKSSHYVLMQTKMDFKVLSLRVTNV